MRLLYCIPKLYNAAGMERVLTEKVNYLVDRMGYAVTLLTTEVAPQGMPEVYFPLSPKVEVVHLHLDYDAEFLSPLPKKLMAHYRKNAIYKRALKQLIQEKQIDVCISLGGKELEFLHALPVACRKMAEIHFTIKQRANVLMMNHRGCLWSMLGRLRNHQMIRQIRPLDAFVVLTAKDAQYLQEHGCHNVQVVHNPCSLPAAAYQKGEKCVLAIGRLHREKGFDKMLTAWQQVHAQYPDWHLRIVGDGEEREALQQQVERLGLSEVVEMPGIIKDMASELAKAAIVAMSSLHEGLPMAIVEAMTCSVPCVAFDCPEGPRELIRDGETGYLVPLGDTDALARQIALLIAQPQLREKMGRRAAEIAKEEYTLQAIMPQWINIFTNLNKGKNN